MISWILEAFRTDPDFLLTYQEKYQYLLVDEYQDTSGSQNELIRLLISYWDSPNIFVVGDDDQSIFRFQGANVENIEQYHTRYARDLNSIMRSEEHTSELQSLMRISYAVFCLKKKKTIHNYYKIDYDEHIQ